MNSLLLFTDNCVPSCKGEEREEGTTLFNLNASKSVTFAPGLEGLVPFSKGVLTQGQIQNLTFLGFVVLKKMFFTFFKNNFVVDISS